MFPLVSKIYDRIFFVDAISFGFHAVTGPNDAVGVNTSYNLALVPGTYCVKRLKQQIHTILA